MTAICTHCNGTGHTPYLAFNIVSRKTTQVTEATYLALPETEDEAEYRHQNYCRGDIDVCRYCYGAGEVEVEFDEAEERLDIAEHKWEERRDRR